jgi:hypothetical protein
MDDAADDTTELAPAPKQWRLEHDPEKWKPVFRKGHASSKY